ncbi:hypothetical protein [Clostridium cochlearium]|nr:hypothetical protein [Clostridium cochlearium]
MKLNVLMNELIEKERINIKSNEINYLIEKIIRYIEIEKQQDNVC